jgi:molybdopterin-guanine dinucleotide biosynthesis protein A
MTALSQVSVAILTGGSATRFDGRDKSALVVDGRSILDRQLDELAPLADDVMLVGRSARSQQARSDRRSGGTGNGWSQLREISDRVPGSGPLGGIHAALVEAKNDAVLVVACDMPFVTAPFARYLLSLAGAAHAVVPCTDDGCHPLCAVYTRACLEAAARLLAERRLAMRELIDRVPVRVVTTAEIRRFGAPSRLLANVNTPAEYADLEALQDHQR